MEKYNPINSSNEASNKTGTSPVKLQKTGNKTVGKFIAYKSSSSTDVIFSSPLYN
jgi:hypothetical protein